MFAFAGGEGIGAARIARAPRQKGIAHNAPRTRTSFSSLARRPSPRRNSDRASLLWPSSTTRSQHPIPALPAPCQISPITRTERTARGGTSYLPDAAVSIPFPV